ncbi:MAG: spermidine synthase [Archaeoglobales archaeon]|nr:MAG: spermidine synthase [Archaeoglobales archaeon]
MRFVERYNGSGLILDVERLIYEFRGIQNIQIFETKSFGKMLVIDGKVQFTERDEAFYHEMLVHPVMMVHENPRRVLVIGGGDGGAVREILKHNPREVVVVEIDENVVRACRRYVGIDRGALDDERVGIKFEDGFKFVRYCNTHFDVIIVDGTDPNPVSQVLTSREFYDCCARICEYFVTQSQSPFVQSEHFKSIYRNAKFKNKAVYLGFVPSYPHGLWSYLIGSDVRDIFIDLEVLRERFEERGIETVYYTPEVHVSAFALPRWVKDVLSK